MFYMYSVCVIIYANKDYYYYYLEDKISLFMSDIMIINSNGHTTQNWTVLANSTRHSDILSPIR